VAEVKVFISYSSADRAEALAVRRLLTARGCTVWLDVFDIRVAADLRRELGEGIGGADVLCLLLSPTAVASPWVAEEIARGEEHAAKRGLRLVAVLLRPCRPPDRLLGRVMLDATAGIASSDVSVRLARAVLGAEAVGDLEIDAAMQEALQAKQNEMEAALVLPELAAQLDAVRGEPIRKLEISFRGEALPRDEVLAISFTFDPLFSQPMWFLFAHYREGRTWPRWMKTIEERDHREIRSDGKRIDGRFEWFDQVRVLDPHHDATDLRDLPVTFDLEFSGEAWQPGGSIASYTGGPTVPHLKQSMEVPPLATLVGKGASFAVALLGAEEGSQQPVALEENDLDVRIVGTAGNRALTLFRSAHGPVERAVLRGTFLQNRKSPIEREAILGIYGRPRELEAEARRGRREAAFALLDKPEAALSPDERRVVGLLRYARAKLAMFRVFGAAPPPGPAREELHRTALGECMAVCRILGPIAEQDPRIDDVGMTFWAASSLATYYLKGQAPERAVPYAEAAVGIVEEASRRDPEEPEYQRWQASGLARLAEAQAGAGDQATALASLQASIEVLRALQVALPSDGRRRDLREALEAALKRSDHWEAVSAESRQAWATLARSLG
jgi:TIR domain